MSRTYRPRLSKDKAVAQRVGEELERQRQEEFSVARQLAAIKVLEQGNEATSCSNSTKPTTVVQQAQVRVSSNALTPSLERRHVGSISSGRSREEPARSESQASVLTSAAPASTSNGRTANARRRAASASPSPAENRNGGIDWSCLSCSLLNPITSTVCSMCRTKNYQQASVGRGTGKGRGARARESHRRLRADGTVAGATKGSSSNTSKEEMRVWDGNGDGGNGGTLGETSGRSMCSQVVPCPVETVGTNTVTGRSQVIEGRLADNQQASTSTHSAASNVTPGMTNTPRRGLKRGRDQTRAAPASLAVSPPRAPTGLISSPPQEAKVVGSQASGERSSSLDGGRRRRRSTRLAPGSTIPMPRRPVTPRVRDGVDILEELSPAVTLSADVATKDTSALHETDDTSLREEHCGMLGEGVSNDKLGMGRSVADTGSGVQANTSSCPLTETVEGSASPAETRAETRMQTPSQPGEGMDARSHPPSVLVTALSNDVPGEEHTQRRPSLAEVGTTSNPVPSTELAPSHTMQNQQYAWPSVTRAARLDFTGRSAMWEVSSVVVTTAHFLRAAAVGANGAKPTSGACAGSAVIVCHSGGVSVWTLTDTAAVCTHVSPALAGVSHERLRASFDVVAVVSGGKEEHRTANEAKSWAPATCVDGGTETCIFGVGRHQTDPGLPVIRVWKASCPLGVIKNVDIEGGMKQSEASSPVPSVLTVTLKKKYAAFFPPVAPRDAKTCLCVCRYSSLAWREGGGGDDTIVAEESSSSGEITTVMALGGKAVRLICAPGRRGPEEIKAKALPTGSLGNTAIFTSLAPVPSNPFLVWAAVPCSNSVLLWDVRELQLLFALPLAASSICVPAAAAFPLSLKLPLPPSGAATARLDELALSVSRRHSRLLCLLATGGVDRGYDNGSAPSSAQGCEIFGICCAEEGSGVGLQDCIVSALRLGGDRESFSISENGGDSGRRDQREQDDRSFGACWKCLTDGGGFLVGIDERGGAVVARDVRTGDTRALVRTELGSDNVRLISLDCDRKGSILAVITGGLGSAVATAVELYVLRDADAGQSDRRAARRG